MNGNMKILRHSWSDIRRGENIDLYLTVGIAIILALLNFLGLAPQSLLASMTLAVLGLLAVTSLVNRHRFEETLKKIQDTQSQEGVFVSDFPADWLDTMEKSSELWIMGINLSRVVSDFSLLEKKLRRGDTIKALLVSPKGSAFKISGMRRREAEYSEQNLSLIRASLASLCKLRVIAPDRIEIRTIDYPLSFGVFAVDPDKTSGILFLSYFPFRTPGGAIPKLVLKPKNGLWYDHFREEMRNLWDSAVPWVCTGKS